jgi:hypothetical protein
MAKTAEWHASWRIGAGAFLIAAAVQIGSSVWPEKIKPHPYLFVGLFLVGLAFVVVPTARALWSFVSHHRHPEEPVAALEIIFEPMNPARRFWSLESHTDAIGRRYPPYWEYRVEIKNSSAKTIRNVMVIVERTGPCPEMPYVPPFKRTQLEKCDINPNCSELVKVITWPQSKILKGMLAGESAWA